MSIWLSSFNIYKKYLYGIDSAGWIIDATKLFLDWTYPFRPARKSHSGNTTNISERWRKPSDKVYVIPIQIFFEKSYCLKQQYLRVKGLYTNN